ncbi:redoxin domain-containing protein [Terrilactibacillus sp. BCM23-1]|uniref:Redoxin domain-containing protein n=1 Tax=Terrilactibacillus tamarindi TaxID=2599694 RepID=A0A6N8CLC0_9BACI|nr:TlpA disulfide reductase family protein [Terrilactibacillus tamarindi]MTT30692.1 redoxin domain-containing protein [Terrilactibacillus tamarindi]
MFAPQFTLFELQSRQNVSLSDFRGMPVMLTFWVSWCPDCQRDMPNKVQFYQSLDKNTLAFLTVNVTGREHSPESGPQFVYDHQLPFPVLIDQGRELYDAFGCTGVPTTIILDKNHEIAYQFGDKASFYDILQALSSVLNQ